MDRRVEEFFEYKLTKEERVALLHEIEVNKDLKEDFIEHKNLFSLLTLSQQETDEQEGRESYAKFIQTYKRRSLFQKTVKTLRLTAAVAIVSFLSIAVFSQLNKEKTIQHIVKVPAGQRANITLGDGTEVILNSNTVLKYESHFGIDSRNIELVGEAYIHVKKNENMPFIITSGETAVKVFGTTFNIKHSEENKSTSVALIEGKLKVEDRRNPALFIDLAPNNYVTHLGDEMTVSKITDMDQFLWTQGIISFNEKSLDSITKYLSDHYSIPITLANPDLASHTYSGKFRQDDGPIEILRIIQQIHRFKIESNNNQVIIM